LKLFYVELNSSEFMQIFHLMPPLLGLVFCFMYDVRAVPPVPKCSVNQHWVKSHQRRAYIRQDGTKVSSAYISAHCADNPPSYAEWKSRITDEKSKKWSLRGEKQKLWSEDEKERLFESLSELPEELLLSSIVKILRFDKSSLDPKNPASGEAGEIVIYNTAFDSNIDLSRVLSHELAHELYRQLPVADKEIYRINSGWIVIRNPVTK
jgi:hypothetical protein